MNHVRQHIGHVLLGLVVGTGSAWLWIHVLRDSVPLWVAGVAAVGGVFAVEWALAAVQQRRTARRPRLHRRAHARPAKPRKEAA
ncbi:hypothetical protein ACFC08_28645 [Streptomyces sp. NPDC056112]|uniref:hypothetical protein n=1 Tax=Streptomyces sp. NPDC056112 TaxID=3345715 RepID=UPI0035DCB7FF